jgi:hypothetical protein
LADHGLRSSGKNAEVQKIIAETGDFPLAPAIYPYLKDAEKVVANAIFMETLQTNSLRN